MNYVRSTSTIGFSTYLIGVLIENLNESIETFVNSGTLAIAR